MTIDCGCDEEHFSFEFDTQDFELWFDNQRVLKGVGLATLPTLGEVVESSDDWTLVEIEPDVFVEWLDQLSARRAAVEEAFQSAGRSWKSQYFWSLEPQLRELAAHSAREGSAVSASLG